ncbi:glycerol-3-phosphate ABC transporter ATP-binding protein [Pullulanibacillus camelliae]|uniref:Glycerol-3-phosphate ABC transporter ATP-binding protein n=1 Tax=Pullulanibacillus camelliae TaxID=1707096 RepID=A0A8J2VFZ8_9BACL|nr:sn-glycerol-3-phosphate ABC transporter ATP-binding protein UgpC [Pullulanibacillus camelliae]GGE29926.1 glycerol-3-phosphate ABC transporter ATP-binding protein [Pullulanibacillus camelliae]
MTQIEMKAVSKTYNKKNTVLKGIDFSVEKGEFFILVGPSGCGKSTILRMIAGLEEISEGQLFIANRLANDLLPKERQISMVFQNYALYPHMTVKENVLFGIGHLKNLSKAEKEKRLAKALELVQLQEYLHRKPRELSGGQRQRVALARAIVSEAPICLMDEPLSNLDAKLRAQMRTEIRQLQQRLGLTLIYVTHDQVEAMTMGDRIMILNEGSVQQIGRPIDIYNHPANTFVASFIGSPQMNMIEAPIMDNDLKISTNASVQLPFSPEKSKYLVGVRPEKLKPQGETGDLILKVFINTVEQLGNETILGFQMRDQQWKAKWNGQWTVQPDERISVYLSPKDLYYFDVDSREQVVSSQEQWQRGGVTV